MGKEIKFNYFYGMEADRYSFYRIPKLLFTNELFSELSCEEKVLYGLMLDRMSLSVKNRWFDSKNRVYIIFTVEDVIDLINCKNQKAVKILAELDKETGIGLIEKIGSTDEIIEKLKPYMKDISKRTFFRRKQEAVYQVGVLLWGYTTKDCQEFVEYFEKNN